MENITNTNINTLYFTITGTYYRYGQEIFEPGMPVHLVKEPDNHIDKEAISVTVEGLGQVGYVANSPYTVQGESYSAGRRYDKISDEADGVVKYVLPKGVLCQIVEESDTDGSTEQ